MPARRTYARTQSRLYKINSPAQLATVLRLTPPRSDTLPTPGQTTIRRRSATSSSVSLSWLRKTGRWFGT